MPASGPVVSPPEEDDDLPMYATMKTPAMAVTTELALIQENLSLRMGIAKMYAVKALQL